MPRYYFHIQDNHTHPDREGTELLDLQAARVESVRLSGEILKHHAETFWTVGEWHLQTTDHTGLTLFTLTFLAVDAPATRRTDPRAVTPARDAASPTPPASPAVA